MEKVFVGLRRIAELVVGKRKMIRVSDFDVGITRKGGERLKEDLSLGFVPRGRVEVRRSRVDHQEIITVDVTRLRS